MKHSRIFLALTVLVLASLACNALSRAGSNPTDVQPQTEEPANIEPAETKAPPASNDTNENSDVVVSGDYPMTDDAFNVTDMGDAGLLYYTNLSLEAALQFYRDEYTARGYTEREILTTVADGVFSIVFDGDPSGKAVVVQSVDLGDSGRTITITMGDY